MNILPKADIFNSTDSEDSIQGVKDLLIRSGSFVLQEYHPIYKTIISSFGNFKDLKITGRLMFRGRYIRMILSDNTYLCFVEEPLPDPEEMSRFSLLVETEDKETGAIELIEHDTDLLPLFSIGDRVLIKQNQEGIVSGLDLSIKFINGTKLETITYTVDATLATYRCKEEEISYVK